MWGLAKKKSDMKNENTITDMTVDVYMKHKQNMQAHKQIGKSLIIFLLQSPCLSVRISWL